MLHPSCVFTQSNRTTYRSFGVFGILGDPCLIKSKIPACILLLLVFRFREYDDDDDDDLAKLGYRKELTTVCRGPTTRKTHSKARLTNNTDRIAIFLGYELMVGCVGKLLSKRAAAINNIRLCHGQVPVL